jgi:hypothetical protein
MQQAESVLSWVHFGDLHIKREGEQNHRDFQALIDIANRHLAGRVTFALLPGDNADDGAEAQFRVVRTAIDRLAIPLHILPGDHDFHTRSLDAFHSVLGAERLPKAVATAGHRCLFLDIVSASTGGPDFCLDDAQLNWLQDQLERADADSDRPAIFMHAYPADLRTGAERLRSLFGKHRVACVDMGHTHYNELANDGRTIFMATRSTGQIEEGPVGFSVAAIDAGVVSWRFAPLAGGWPLVLVTRPADHRLVTNPDSADQIVRNALTIRAKIWSASGIQRVTAQIDDGVPIALASDAADTALWQALHDARDLPAGYHALTVAAQDATGAYGHETITFFVDRHGSYQPPPRHADGSDRDALTAWLAKGVLGTQLGPNRNGRKW